jgi:septum formation protein
MAQSITKLPDYPLTKLPKLILASASPRRAQLLEDAGYRFEIRPADVDERVRPAEDPAGYVRRLAAEKLATTLIRSAEPDIIVVAADTAVVLDGDVLGKPSDENDAATMLRRLSGRAHEVMTGVSVGTRTTRHEAVETSRVWFVELSAADIDWYVASREGADKAGGYGIQGLAARFIPRIDGSYSNVVGLPVALVHAMLKDVLR